MAKTSFAYSIMLLSNALNVRWTSSFVAQFLMKSPQIADNKELWKRSPLNFAEYGNLTLTLLKSLDVPTPSYVQILEQGTLSVTSFSLLRQGCIMQFDLTGLSGPKILMGDYLWPNELSLYKDSKSGMKYMLIPDGFLMLGQNDGGIYAIKDPHCRSNSNSHPIRITPRKPGWFYHRAVHVKLPGGHEGILTARANKPIFGNGFGELVWLTIPTHINSTRSSGGWHETVLLSGPDVMFEVVDLDDSDRSIEVVAAHFFGRKLSVHSLEATDTYPFVRISHSSSINTVGRPYGLCLANLEADDSDTIISSNSENIKSFRGSRGLRSKAQNMFSSRYLSKASRRNTAYNSFTNINNNNNNYMNSNSMGDVDVDQRNPTHILVTTHECSYDLPSALNMAFSAIGGSYPSVKIASLAGSTSSISSDIDSTETGSEKRTETQQLGGSLFAYKLPDIKRKRKIRANGWSSPSAISSSPSWVDSSKKGIIKSNFTLSSDPESDGYFRPEEEVADNGHCSSFNAVAAAVSLPTVMNDVENPDSQDVIKITQTNSMIVNNISEWQRSTIHRGFKVRGWGGIFSPGAPGFPYVFRMPGSPKSPPLILVAGDCTGSAYIFTPSTAAAEPHLKSQYLDDTEKESMSLPQPELSYKLAFEIECGATVGSAAVAPAADGSCDVNLYIPSYELNKVHVYSLSANQILR